jgi:hypothetical protein
MWEMRLIMDGHFPDSEIKFILLENYSPESLDILVNSLGADGMQIYNFDDSLRTRVDKLVSYCETRGVLDTLISIIDSENNNVLSGVRNL